MTPSSWQRARCAFTLVELLVAVIIVIALIALIFASLHGLGDRAKGVNCAAGIRQFGAAALAFRGDHNGFLPPGYLISPSTSSNSNPHSGIDIKKMLLEGRYLAELPYCPSMRLTAQGRANLRGSRAEKDRIKEMGSYGINLFLTQTKLDGLPGPYWGSYPYPGDAKMVFIAEVYFCGLTFSFDHPKFALNGADWGGLFVAPRDHGNKRLHFMFLDGHIALLGPKVRSDGSYDWSGVFDSWGRDGKYINTRTAYSSN